MAAPLSVKRNNYFENRKSSTIFTPIAVSEFISRFIDDICQIKDLKTILDPAVGSGNLLIPWQNKGINLLGIDAVDHNYNKSLFLQGDFLSLPTSELLQFVTDKTGRDVVDMVIMNPPFNNDFKMKAEGGNKGRGLLPEMFLKKVFNSFGYDTRVALICPMGFCLNQRNKSKRWRWLRDAGMVLNARVPLPLDVFEGVEFHVEILFFNFCSFSIPFMSEDGIQEVISNRMAEKKKIDIDKGEADEI